jgi:putative ABC transport system ATP-binding protein
VTGPSAQPPAAAPAAALVTVSGLVFRWRRDRAPVLDIPALAVARGEKLFLRGPSGSGKSTLLSLLGGVIIPERGRITLLGTDLGALPGSRRDAFRADHVGFIFQLFNLIPYLGLVDNVLLPCRFSALRRARLEQWGLSPEAEARRLLARLDLEDEALLRQPVTELSVGQQQRVAAARALIGGPELIIADEPTSALDSDRRRSFLELLGAECAAVGTTLVFVSHDPSLAETFDRCIDLAVLNQADGRQRRATP